MRRGVQIAVPLLAVAAGLAGACGEGPQEPPRTPPARPAVAAPDPEQLGAFALLRRPATTQDRVPRRLLTPHRAPGGRAPAPGSARRAFNGTGNAPLWVVPGHRELCLAFEETARPGAQIQAGSVCQDTAVALAGRLVLVLGRTRTRPVAVWGVVPDGVRAVTAIGAGGRRVRAPVIGNTYAVMLTAPARVAFTVRGGGQPERRVVVLADHAIYAGR